MDFLVFVSILFCFAWSHNLKKRKVEENSTNRISEIEKFLVGPLGNGSTFSNQLCIQEQNASKEMAEVGLEYI